MLNMLTGVARKIDEWLKHRMGRLYNGVLSAGLVLAIIDTVRKIVHDVSDSSDHKGNILKLAVEAVFQAMLLVDQLTQLDNRRERIRQRREARRTAGHVQDVKADRSDV